jgi:chromate transporter
VLLGLPLWAATASPLLSTVDAFYRAGAPAFGGGHVVLPLLKSAVVPSGAVGNAEFLAGYGASQAVPGPLFTFAAYRGR